MQNIFINKNNKFKQILFRIIKIKNPIKEKISNDLKKEFYFYFYNYLKRKILNLIEIIFF
jgi:hypothetical protein